MINHTLILKDTFFGLVDGFEKELGYFDQKGGYNVDFNYRDAKRTAVTEKTKNILINIDGIYSINRAMVERTLKEVIEIITKYCGGKVEMVGVVSCK